MIIAFIFSNCVCSFIIVSTAPSVHITPSRRLDRLMTSATFKCTVHGQEPLEILWSRIDGRPLPERATIKSTSKNSKTLVIERLRIMDQETYICSGRNDYGLSTEKATLVVIGMWKLSFHCFKIHFR